MSGALDPKGSNRFIDHGRIIDEAGRTPSYIASLAADDKGNVFMKGSWLLKPGDQPTVQFQYKPEDGIEYKTLKRGEFFAWVNVNDDLK